MKRIAFVALAIICVCQFGSAQVKSNNDAYEAIVACASPLESEPLTPYGFAKATLVSLWHARNAAEHDVQKETKGATNFFSLTMGMMRIAKMSTNDFICAKRSVKPFSVKQSGENIQTAAQFLLMVYDQHIGINQRLIDLLKKTDTITQAEFMDQLSTLQVERGQRWADLVEPVKLALLSLLDENHTDKNGNIDRLLATKAEKQAILSWATEHFPELKDGTPKDKWSEPTKTTELYFAFFSARKCSDE
jgi:hypothetical protein